MFIEDALYQDILRYMPIPTVDILFINSHDELLLAKRNNEPLMWVYYIPGGRVNKWEKSLHAAKRKTKEELGIDIDISRLQYIWVYDDIFENSAFENISTHCIPVTYAYFLDPSEEDQVALGDAQHSDWQFFSLTDPSLHEMVKMRIVDLRKIKK
jgi:colanic acid biosynthesis protein WcaH